MKVVITAQTALSSFSLKASAAAIFTAFPCMSVSHVNTDVLHPYAQLLGADYGHGCIRALPHILGPDIEVDLSIDVYLDDCRRKGIRSIEPASASPMIL